MRFTLKKTGVFDERYIPDDIYYTRIDTFYNDWNTAKVIDNKYYYENILSPAKGVKHPDPFLRRINGFWIDSNWKQIGNDKVEQILEENHKFF